MFGHEPFEDFLDLDPDAQHALAMRFQDAIDLITTDRHAVAGAVAQRQR